LPATDFFFPLPPPMLNVLLCSLSVSAIEQYTLTDDKDYFVVFQSFGGKLRTHAPRSLF
jgi:hypothetical protein